MNRGFGQESAEHRQIHPIVGAAAGGGKGAVTARTRQPWLPCARGCTEMFCGKMPQNLALPGRRPSFIITVIVHHHVAQVGVIGYLVQRG